MTTALIPLPSSADHANFITVGHLEHGCRVVHLAGELDIANRDAMIGVCTCTRSAHDVVVDLSGLTFMDCTGYGALISARVDLMRQGRKLTIANAIGEPAMLIALIERLEIRAGQNAVS